MAYNPPHIDYTSTAGAVALAAGFFPWFGAPGDDAHDVVRIESGDIAQDQALTDLVLINLFSWRRAKDSDEVLDGASRNGWWADPADGFGSRLWLLAGATASTETARTAEGFVEEALAFLTSEGIASSVTAKAVIVNRSLRLEITVKQPNRPDLVIRFADLWEVL